MNVGDITVTDPNIHAGAKYMNQLRSKTVQQNRTCNLI